MYGYHMDQRQNPEEEIYSLNFEAVQGMFIQQWEIAIFAKEENQNNLRF